MLDVRFVFNMAFDADFARINLALHFLDVVKYEFTLLLRDC